MGWVGHSLFMAALGLKAGGPYRRLLSQAASPEAAQTRLLRRILAQNAGTEFGRRHGFSDIATVDEFRRAVPIHTYEDLRPLIERQELTGDRCLTADQPVYYHRTSGTLGEPKNIPVTADGMKRMKGDHRLAAYCWTKGTAAIAGKSVSIVGAAVEGHMAGGTPYGSASGLIYRSQPSIVRSRYVLPYELMTMSDYDARYLAIAAYGLAEAKVTAVASANPSTFLKLLSVVNQNLEAVLDSIATGRLPAEAERLIPAGDRLPPSPARASNLEEMASKAPLGYADVWPDLRAVFTWTGGSCGIALGALKPLLPPAAEIIELGYTSSEFRGTINLDSRQDLCLPTLGSTMFEFAPRREWESGSKETLGLHELEGGEEYYVIVTTGEGLYRYDINDILRVDGRVRNTPTLQFVQKGKGVTNITGEKVTESQVLNVVLQVLSKHGPHPRFFVMIAADDPPAYTLYVEWDAPDDLAGIAAEVDRTLSEVNIEYKAKRASGRLLPLTLGPLRRGAGGQYRQHCVSAGQRDAQFKYLHLQHESECSFDFRSLVSSPEA